jgi:hypothetical protein
MKSKTFKEIYDYSEKEGISFFALMVVDEVKKQIKQDIKNSTSILGIKGDYKLPNGKYCTCDIESSCTYHREGIRMMKFFGITEEEINKELRK